MTTHEATEQAYKNGYEKGKQDAMKWISVKDRFPEHLAFILCYLIYDEICVCQWDSIHERWIENTWNYDKDSITHWMPLPTVPKEE